MTLRIVHAVNVLLRFFTFGSLDFSGLEESPGIPDQSGADSNTASGGIRDLQWGQLNFIHSTDTHGWLAGHGSQDHYEFSGTWGDYISFVQHMRQMADDKNVDLIVVDTGDKYDGNGLSDGSDPNGQYIPGLFMNADADIILTGNHELYKPHVTDLEYEVVQPHYGDRYLASNVDILHNGEWKPLGERYKIMTTPRHHLKVLAFGFLFNFRGGSTNSRVMKVEQAVKENWFQNAIRTPGLDAILLAGHIPVRFNQEFDIIIAEIRKVLPRIPIQGLGGHSHIRDYRVFDDYAVALESGRFLETIGWASIDNVSNKPPKFARTYIDFNPESLAHHSKKTLGEKCTTPGLVLQSESDKTLDDCFDTIDGLDLNDEIAYRRQELNLTEPICEIPQSYYMSRAKYPSPSNIFSVMEEHVLTRLNGTCGRNDLPRFIIGNTGAIRYDLIAGNFTRDTRYTLSPFHNKWNYIPNVPIEDARKILPLLNRKASILLAAADQSTDELDFTRLNIPSQRKRTVPTFIGEDHAVTQDSFLRGGYVTYDDFGHDGDDTPHKRWDEFPIPNCVQAETGITHARTDTVDVVFFDFLIPFMVQVFQAISRPELLVHMGEYGGQQVPDLFIEYFKTF